MLKKLWLPWLRNDVFTKWKNDVNLCKYMVNFEKQSEAKENTMGIIA